MDVLKILRREEHKLLQVSGKVEGELSRVRAAISALNGVHRGPVAVRRPHKLKGRKLSAEHKRAIRLGIARAKKASK